MSKQTNIKPTRKNGYLIFPDYPEFRPNVTPKEMFEYGIFRGTYFRPIHSAVTGKDYKNVHKKFRFLDSVSEDRICRELTDADVNINKYKVHVGTTLEFWEAHNWIREVDPYGQLQWFLEFYNGRRSYDDERQIKRWLGICGPKGRFRNNLLNQIRKKAKEIGVSPKKLINDYTISPKIRQTLLQWGYEITEHDLEF